MTHTANQSPSRQTPVEELALKHEPGYFLKSLVRHLSGSLQDVIGLDDAEGLVSIVGQSIGDDINTQYRTALAVERLDREQLADVLVDLKRRIDGDFHVIEQTDDYIVFGNNRCPFGKFVEGRPSLCMMTSNVFGVIAAENLGYARISLDETIADGASGCRVTLHLRPGDDTPADSGREYYARPRD